MPVYFAAIADDDTGATDLAGMLAMRGMNAVVLMDEPSASDFNRWTQDAECVVLGTASRSIAPADAYARTLRAVRLLQTLQPQVLEVKYCSTFDSTAQGNIGPSLDAALDATGERFTVCLPALPVNGRTTYMGHHFVGSQLLSDSSMKHHPLTPMTDANLVAHLQSQTRRRVGLLPLADVRKGSSHATATLQVLRDSGVEIAILDCTSDEDLCVICEAISGLRLISGSSAPAMYLPRNWTDRPPLPLALRQRKGRGGMLVVAGSYSEATRGQNEWLRGQGAVTVTLSALQLALQQDVGNSNEIGEALLNNQVCLVQLSRNREEVQAHLAASGKTAMETGTLIAGGLARVIKQVLSHMLPHGLIVAGGETSGAITRALAIGAIRVGANIEPGVPLCLTLTDPELPAVFKSGNFGGPEFYGRAMEAIRALYAAK